MWNAMGMIGKSLCECWLWILQCNLTIKLNRCFVRSLVLYLFVVASLYCNVPLSMKPIPFHNGCFSLILLLVLFIANVSCCFFAHLIPFSQINICAPLCLICPSASIQMHQLVVSSHAKGLLVQDEEKIWMNEFPSTIHAFFATDIQAFLLISSNWIDFVSFFHGFL